MILAMELTARSSTDQARTHIAPSRQKTRYGNGSSILPGVDGRSSWVRRAKELIQAHVTDLGGPENCSAAEHAIVRRCAVLITELERRERKFALSDGATDIELDIYARVAGNLRRLLESVGLQRRARDVTSKPPSVADYLDHISNAEPAE
jgi:hypothetical protein